MNESEDGASKKQTLGSKLTEIDDVSESLTMSGLSRLALATSSTPWVHSLYTSVSYLEANQCIIGCGTSYIVNELTSESVPPFHHTCQRLALHLVSP